jgi:hypothetical protein
LWLFQSIGGIGRFSQRDSLAGYWFVDNDGSAIHQPLEKMDVL